MTNTGNILIAALKEIEDLGANGCTAARLGNIAHAALIEHRAASRPAQEPVAWRILCTTSGATGYLYTEKLPFDPGPGVRVRREPEPLYSLTGENEK